MGGTEGLKDPCVELGALASLGKVSPLLTDLDQTRSQVEV